MNTSFSDHFGSTDFADRTIDSDGLEKLGRLGWVAKGTVYALMGILTVPIALGGSDDQASRKGALGEIAENSFGGPLLLLAGVGLALYAMWRVITAFLPGENDLDTLAHRVGYGMSAVLYAFLAWSAISFVVSDSGGSQSGGQSTLEKISRTLMENTAGRWALGLGAVIGLGVAGYFVKKAIDGSFTDRLALHDAKSEERTLIERLGTAGWIGRAITTALLSFFVLLAAWTSDPDEARGLDEALKSTADDWWGSALVLVAGVGLVAYGVFAVLSARHRRLIGP